MGKAACPWRPHSLNSLVLQVRWLQHGTRCWCCRSEMEMKLEEKRSKTIEGCRKNSSLQSLGITVIIAVDKAWLSQKRLSYWYGLMIPHGKNQLIHWHLSMISLSSVNMSVLLEHPLWKQTFSATMVTWACMQKTWGKNNWRVRKWNVFSSTCVCGGRWEGEQLLIQAFLAWMGDCEKTPTTVQTVYIPVTNTGKYRLIPSLCAEVDELRLKQGWKLLDEDCDSSVTNSLLWIAYTVQNWETTSQ